MNEKHKEKPKQEDKWFVKGHDNIFVDLGFSEEEANELTMKSFLSWAVEDAIKESKSTQTAIAKRLGIDQPKVSKLRNGKMSEFSIGRLTEFLLDFGYDVRIEIASTPKKETRGKLIVDVDERRKTPLKKRRATA